MKKILMLTHHDMSIDDGDTIRVKKIIHLLEGSLDVECFGLKYSSVFSLPSCTFKLIRKVLSGDWDYVYVFNQDYIVMIVYLIKKFKKYKLVNDALLTWKVQGEGNFRAFMEKVAGNCSDYVLNVSELGHAFFPKSIIIPTFVDTDKFKMDMAKREKIRKDYGISEDIVVGLIGSFNNDYNGQSLEYLYQNIDKFDSRIKFLIIGSVDNRIVNPKIIYTGYVADYVGYLSALDALMVYRKVRTDGAINRMVEVMSMGIPAFANTITSKSMDYAADGVDFFVSDDLPQKINEVMLKGTQAGVNAQHLAEEYYSAKKYKKVLLEALK